MSSVRKSLQVVHHRRFLTTLQIFTADNEVVDYNGGRTFDELKAFVLEHAGKGADDDEDEKEEESKEEEEDDDSVERDEL